MWCIFYEDGTTYSSDQGHPEDAPGSSAVVAIAQLLNDNYRNPSEGPRLRRVAGGDYDPVTEGQDFFIFREGQWFASNLVGLAWYFQEPGYKVVKMGRWVPQAVYSEVMDRAREWMKAATKNGQETT